MHVPRLLGTMCPLPSLAESLCSRQMLGGRPRSVSPRVSQGPSPIAVPRCPRSPSARSLRAPATADLRPPARAPAFVPLPFLKGVVARRRREGRLFVPAPEKRVSLPPAPDFRGQTHRRARDLHCRRWAAPPPASPGGWGSERRPASQRRGGVGVRVTCGLQWGGVALSEVPGGGARRSAPVVI